MDFDEYLQQRVDGIHIDPWIKIHESLGAKMLFKCSNAMEITGSVLEWENWTGLKLTKDGDYHIPGGLFPIKVDLKNNFVRYIEPNIWMEYVLK